MRAQEIASFSQGGSHAIGLGDRATRGVVLLCSGSEGRLSCPWGLELVDGNHRTCRERVFVDEVDALYYEGRKVDGP